ncbi:Leucine-rich repeat [Phytophthora infestans]|nr:Leucine-rich repeat [Phytophthora infestans]KAI9987988.1 hypothetical protein PInf_024248 [Phytophthora infestans]
MLSPPPPPPHALEPAAGPIIISHVNAGIEFIDDLSNDDERDELVEQMNLHGNAIQSMDGLEAFNKLVELCLSSNYIEEISFHALQPLAHLRVLDLSANSISSTIGFPQLPRLEELSMAHNCLQGLDGLTRPIKFPKLQYLDLRGNEIAELNDLIMLQRHKRLSHLRLQAANGDQANPVCDLEDYHHAVIHMLPKLTLLDEEEVEFLKEMGSLHMPKYRSLMRRIVESKRSDRQSPREDRQRPGRGELPQHNQLNRGRYGVSPPSVDTTNLHHTTRDEHKTSSPELKSALLVSTLEPIQQQRLVLKDTGTNTSVDLEKDIFKREQVMAHKETEFLEKEKVFLTRANEYFIKEKELRADITDLHDKYEAAETRAMKAEATVLEMSSRLLQREKDFVDEATNTTMSEDDALEASYQQEIERLSADNSDLKKKVTALQVDVAAMTQSLREAEQRLQEKMATLEKSENKVVEVTGELQHARKTHEAIVTQLSTEVKYHKDHVEQADKRNVHLEQQVTELKANVETVYNKCIEKDEAIQQVKKSLVARQDEIDTLRSQHDKDSERQDKFQQQQQDLYDRQLQASIIQVEMEFRKEFQQSAHKFQLLQRKNQERIKEIKRVREAYQGSLQREAAARAEIDKLEAILADDKKQLFVAETKRMDTFKAAIREQKAKCKEMEQELLQEQKKSAQVAVLTAERDEKRLEIERLGEEMRVLQEQQEAWQKLEDDLRAALKVKDVMLADQLRQIREQRDQNQNAEVQFSDEIAELQTQIEDLEAALDESLQKAAEEEVKNETLSTKVVALEKDVVKKNELLTSLQAELEKKVSALEFLDQEMQRMRSVLENQDELFHKRMQKHVEQQREEVERVRASAEEEREHQVQGWAAERGEMMRKYETLAAELESVATQNTKLRGALDQERRKTAQNDRDMRILLAQIDRERQAKKENLRQIKSLFEQLQREAS